MQHVHLYRLDLSKETFPVGSSLFFDIKFNLWLFLLFNKFFIKYILVKLLSTAINYCLKTFNSYRVLTRLWSIRVNQAMFSGASKMDSYASGNQVMSVKMPTVTSNGGVNKEETFSAENVNAIQNAYCIPQLDKQMPNLITLSLLPRSQWQSLTNLDIIKVSMLFI